jgi:hypothetical protein|tara:strand:- start:14828 stop:15316 length:489 start_codon:yes stop_codon:yes gene_type:complete
MTPFFKSAKVIHEVESDLTYVEIVYDAHVRGKGYQVFTDYMFTKPLVTWQILETKKHTIPYLKFLDIMVEKTVEVRQRMAELLLDKVLSSKCDTNAYIRLTHATKILDPSFQPPIINKKSAWQREFIMKFCKKHIHQSIEECVKLDRLEYFFKVLRMIQREL